MKNIPSKAIAHWLFTGAAMVAIIVIIGGITRLTESGLSMVRWEPISGTLPPLNQDAWQAEFEHYQSSPQFQLKNSHFSLQEFKKIYWWEYIHRLFARTIGLVFLIPFFYFLFTKQLNNRKLRIHLLIIFLLGGFQGFLGWYMVSSGLVDEPRVNHFRLASHLLSALLLLGYILWIGLHIRFGKNLTTTDGTAGIRKFLVTFLVILGIQITYGAFMAGLDAGFFYPTFPLMGSSWGPENVDLIFAEEGWLSLVQNPFLVQFIHRWMPVLLLVFIGFAWYKSEKDKTLSIPQKQIVRALGIMFGVQFILGVFTILYSVPISLGVIHQFGAVLLFVLSLVALFLYRKKSIFHPPN